jgi:peptide/nickel transport system substrate-binding protein
MKERGEIEGERYHCNVIQVVPANVIERKDHTIMKSRKLISATVAGFLIVGLVVVGTSVAPTVAASASSSPVLVIANTSGTTLTQDFNPFVPTGGPYLLGATSEIYEPLIQFDFANPPIYYPWLATSYKWSDGGKVVTFTIRQGVKWSNGTPLTPADVAFTYNLVKSNAGINTGDLAILSVATTGNTVTLTFPTPQFTNFNTIANVPIVPESLWSNVKNPTTYTDPTPVGTGPYVVNSFTPQGVSMTKNPNYWQPGKPVISKLYFQSFLSGPTEFQAVKSNQLQWAGFGIAGLKQGVDNYHFWMGSGSSVALFPNLNVWPTNQLPVRQAISLALGRDIISSEGESGFETPLPNASGLSLPAFKAWLAPSVASMTLSGVPQVAAAKAVLTKAGYVMGKDGYFQTSAGKVVAVTITDPAVFTDYAADGVIMQGELRNAGIDATWDGQGASVWASDLASGKFQLSLHWGAQGITPYNLYDNWLDSKLATAQASGNYERLDSSAMDTDLATLAAAPTLAAQIAALTPIESYVATQLPVIPVVTAAIWGCYNGTDFVGFPSATNPYETLSPGYPAAEVVLLHLSYRS